MKDNNKIIQDISLLYELSLAFGQSLDLRANCEHFLKVLMARKGLTYAAVWIREDQLEKSASNQLRLVYASPVCEVKIQRIDADHYICQRLNEIPRFSLAVADPDFAECVLEQTGEQGHCLIYGLEDIGFLKLHAQHPSTFNSASVSQLENVVRKFALFLNGCIAHEREKKEVEERIKTQEALHQSEEKYRTVVHSLSEGIIITDLDGRVSFVNERMLELTGYQQEELIGKKAYQMLVASSEQKEVLPKLKQRQGGIADEYFLEHVHKNGRRWMARIKGSPYRNAKGEIIGTMGVVNDISAQREVERRIVESEQKFRKIINTSLDAVVTIDAKGKVTEWSRQAERTFGYTRDEAVGQSMSELIVPHAYRQAHEKGMSHFLETGTGPVLNNRIEIEGLDKDGRLFPIELSISPMKIGGKYFFSAFIRDITERKQAEEELIAAKQAAEQARLAEHQFLTNMSHEIRTPMNAVIGMTHLLYETDPNHSQKEYLDALLFSADSLMGIINNILDLSKIEAGELAFEKRTFNLHELFKSLQQTFQFKVRDKAVSVVVDIDPRIEYHLIGDAVRLNQILTNLLGNASKFTNRGTIGIRARLLAATGKQCTLQFQVHDTGIGIDEDKLGLIFETFKQADLGITRKFGGTGLGLAIVKQMVELQGGSIEVESEKGKGSVFSVILPLESSTIKVGELIIKDEKDQAFNKRLQALKVLVVEDNFMNQKLISKIMNLWNCDFEIANSGVQALEKTATTLYDLILMDIHMPEMDGCEATSIIRKTDSNPNQATPIVALTAAALLDEKNRALDAGMNDFLAKPFSPKQLKKIMLKWMGIKEPPTLSTIPSLIPKEAILQVDLSYLREMGKGDEAFIKEMILIFLKDIPKAIQQMQVDLEVENWRSISDVAHRIKSNFMIVGMKVQQDIARTIELDIKNHTFEAEALSKMIYQLKSDTKLACPILERELMAFQN